MTKKEFLEKGRKGLSGLPQEEIEERLAFYSEMIDDRMEEGLSETDAIKQIIATDETVSRLFSNSSKKEEWQREKSAENGAKTALIVAGSPLWVVLVVTAFVIGISLLVTVWSVVIALWAVFVSLAVSAPVSVLGGIGIALLGRPLAGLAMIGIGLICAGLAV